MVLKKQPEEFRKRIEATKFHKTVIAAETVAFCVNPLTHYLPGSDKKNW